MKNNEISLIRKASLIAADTLNYLEDKIKVGITTDELNKLAHDYIIKNNGIPAFLNYRKFPKSICVSINEEVVHGIPSERKLEIGDIVSIDVGVCYEGYYGDTAKTFAVGKIDDQKQFLLKHTKIALEKGIAVVKAGTKTGDIGYAIASYLKEYNLGIVEVLVGHGIGKKLHQKPDIPNYGQKGKGYMLKAGMVIAIEPMINAGTKEVVMKQDGWTIVTADNSPSAHFEHTVLVLENGFEILTKR